MSLFTTIGLILLVFIGFKYFMMFKVKLNKGKDVPELSGKYGKAVQSGEKALFYFYSKSCGACKAMTPVVQELSKERKNCFLVDVQTDPVTPGALSVMSTPSTVIVEGGKIQDFLIGPQRKE
ncbi:MAG: thioredoxin family protein, partial [Spirochaetia bacterium]